MLIYMYLCSSYFCCCDLIGHVVDSLTSLGFSVELIIELFPGKRSFKLCFIAPSAGYHMANKLLIVYLNELQLFTS